MWKVLTGVAAAAVLSATLTLGSPAVARGGGHGSHASRCVGICYGVASKVTGLPRNSYVHGYVKRDGTFVQSYTRSR